MPRDAALLFAHLIGNFSGRNKEKPRPCGRGWMSADKSERLISSAL